MTPPIVFSPSARDDLRQIHSYVSQFSPESADALVLAIERRIKTIAPYASSMPLSPEGRRYKLDVRQVVVKGFRVLFRCGNRRLEILRIRHGRRRTVPRKKLG